MAFLGWFVHYVLIFVVLVVVAGLGIFAGKKLSDRIQYDSCPHSPAALLHTPSPICPAGV